MSRPAFLWKTPHAPSVTESFGKRLDFLGISLDSVEEMIKVGIMYFAAASRALGTVAHLKHRIARKGFIPL